MPANLVKSLRDEGAWKKAKKAVGKRYGRSDRHWATVMKVFAAIKAKMNRAR